MPDLRISFEAFILDRQSQRRSPETIGFYTRQLAPFLDWCEEQGVTDALDLTPTLVRRYMVRLEERGLSVRTQQAAGSSVKAMLSFLGRRAG